MKKPAILVGRPFPLGATWEGPQVNFALYSEHATGVELQLFDSIAAQQPVASLPFTERTGHIWHMAVKDIKPGQLYAYRVDGPYEPNNGHRFNKHKLLIDPYAKAIAGDIRWDDAVFGYQVGHPDADLSFSESDSAAFIPKCVVIDQAYDWEGDTSPKIPFHETIIYETHVKGFTKRHAKIPENMRGTYAGLAHPEAIQYFKDLGVTTIELMPVHYFLTSRDLQDKQLSNYWGYNTIGYLCPDAKYAACGMQGDQVKEFKDMVKALHKAGLEVILDVVYNHTAEGNQLGPTLSFRGVDNTTYYRLTEDKRYYMDYTGTGNTLNANLPNVLRLIMDSLRYWILEMHVDGFRFDLAATLARELHEVDRLSSFLDIIQQDPVISQVKLIAEPWDVGEGGYQVGNFPPGWSEWNGKYRDCMRDYWRGADSMLGEFAERFAGSPDLYMDDSRKPYASINFVTAHDGFTLHDLVSYNDKHNEQNGENNQDGDNNNRSWNCGAEGPTDNEEVNKLRQQQKRNLLTTLFLSQGVPMLVAGDEFGRTQQGNNNAYCQDNEISWIDWEHTDPALLDFTRKLIALRKQHPVFCRRKWFQGQKLRGVEDIAWFRPDGGEMQEENWNHDFAKSLGVYLNGKGLRWPDREGNRILDDSFYLLFNASHEAVEFTLPEQKYGDTWHEVLNTYTGNISDDENTLKAGDKIRLEARSVILLKHPVK